MELSEDHIAKKVAVYELPGMNEVRIQRDLPYSDSGDGALTLDVYHPAVDADDPARPAIVTVLGYPDPGLQRLFGVKFKEWGSPVSWARLIAASGLVAINYSNVNPVADLPRVLGHLKANGPALGIDPDRIGLIASSGHGPLALRTVMDGGRKNPIRCAVLICPFTLDLDGSTSIADAATTFRFANPNAGTTVDDLPAETALFIARAGRDEMPGLNEALDRFVSRALARNLPLTLMNHPEGPHAFDVLRADPTSREIIRSALAFLRFHLGR